MLNTATVLKKLNLIFWGSIVIVIDINFSSSTNGIGFNIDWVNDLIGALMIFNGVQYFTPFFSRDTAYIDSLRLAKIGSGILILLSLFLSLIHI